MTLKFGTDGVRGVANVELTPELALVLGRAAARVLGGNRWLVGRDPRRSGPMLTGALAAGLASEGVEVVDLGMLPTPGVAYLAAEDDVPAAMISASHNPFGDNGIKLFTAGGRKLSDAVEEAIEAELVALTAHAGSPDRPDGAAVGLVHHGDGDGRVRYRDHLVADGLGGRRLDDVRVVVDEANGAASGLASDVLRSLGASVVAIHDAPDGTNINERCGSTYPHDLQAAVVAHGADAGLAFDGDADRVLTVDADGVLVDGDQMIAACAIDLHEQGELDHDAVAVTVMTNLGFRQAMTSHGIEVVVTDVGDRYVLEALDERGLVLGGEQSGHVIFRRLASTGDGILTGLRLLDVMARRQTTLAEVAACMIRLPQVLVNVRLARPRPDLLAAMAGEVAAAERHLGDRGRILVRPSGTEPLIRVMVEAPTAAEAGEVAERVAASARALAG
ncbi:MAG: phosphoglucosamine mutase [Acidimicrobiales bacterium]